MWPRIVLEPEAALIDCFGTACRGTVWRRRTRSTVRVFMAFARAGRLVLNAPTDLPDGMVAMIEIDVSSWGANETVLFAGSKPLVFL